MATLEIGQKVSVKGEAGVIRFRGSTKFATGEWIGVELDTGVGKNDGSLQGVRYFQCQKQGNYGVFVRPSMLGNTSQNEKLRPILEVQAIVDKLQTKLRAARAEIDKNKKDLEEAEAKLQQKSAQVDDLEANLERISVEGDYLKSQNITLSLELQQLQTSYADMSAEYEILQEEMDLNKELEEEVKMQLTDSHAVTAEDFQLLVQHNKKLELAVSSLRKLSSEKEGKFSEEIQSLRSEIVDFEELKKTYQLTIEKLKQADTTIAHLQEQLESANELDLIIEYLTRENESLSLKNKDLTETVNELKEIHELDKSLEEDLRKVEQDLKDQITSLLSQITQEKRRVEVLNSKHELLLHEMESLKKSNNSSSSLGSMELESLNLKIKKLLLVIENSNFKSNVSLRALDCLRSLNLKSVSENFREVISTFQNLGMAQSIAREIQTALSKSPTAIKIEILNVFERLCGLLDAVSYQLEYEYEDSDVTFLGTRLELLYSDLLQAFENLHFEDKTSLGALDSHFSTLRLFCKDARFLRSISFFCLTELGLEVNNTHRICESILKVIPQDKGQELRTMKKQIELVKEQCETALEESKFDKIIQPGKLLLIKLPDLSDNLLMTLQQLESDSSVDMDNSITLEIQRYTAALYELSQVIKGNLQDAIEESIFQCIIDRPVEVTTPNELLSDRIEKDKIINDLKLNIEVLEKNMGATIEGKSSKILELKDMLQQAKSEFQDLEAKHKKLVATNKTLENQVQSLFELNALKAQNQIRAIEDLKSKKSYTTEMALAQEISMLRNMVALSSRNREHEDISWLAEPIYPQYGCITYGRQIEFEARARETRALASRILQRILRS